jgi:clan AA aspartic protease
MKGSIHQYQACLTVFFLRDDNPAIGIEFVVDTGFEGAMTLPMEAIRALGLPFIMELDINLADDSSTRVAVHRGQIRWHDEDVAVAVLATGKRPLLGTALLKGSHLGIDFQPEGNVEIISLGEKLG